MRFYCVVFSGNIKFPGKSANLQLAVFSFFIYNTRKKEMIRRMPEPNQKKTQLPLCYSPVTLDNGWYAVSTVPYLQQSREITFLHTHEYCEFGICLEGAGVFLVGPKILPFQRGDCMFIATGEPHLATSLQNTVSRWRWLYLDETRLLDREPALADLARFKGPDFRNCFSGERSVICSLIREMFSCALGGGVPFQKQKMTALLTLFSIEMHRGCCSCGQGTESAAIQRIHFALNEMLSRYGEDISIERLASACSLSSNQFRRVFAKATGSSPQTYLNNLRITMAASMLLRTDLTIAEIAFRCGFPTLSCFNRQFRIMKGTSPGKFRTGRS